MLTLAHHRPCFGGFHAPRATALYVLTPKSLRRLFAFALILCAATTARAQVPLPVTIPVQPAPVVDSLPPFERPNGSLLRAGTLTYALSLLKPDGQTTPLGTRVVAVTDGALGGAPGWLIAEARRGTVVETTDSVYLARGDLTPERWTATIGRAQLGASFSRDSMFGAVDNYQGRMSFAVPVPAGALLSGSMLERIVELLPLRAGYRAGASLVLVDGTAPRGIPVEIHVDGEDRANVGGRAVRCWLVAVRGSGIELRLWVSREGARVVRSEQSTAGGVLVSTLIS